VVVRQFCVYILASNSRTLYIGVTNDLERRISEHRENRVPGFTARYGVNQLFWCEVFADVTEAIAPEERKLKGWTRAKIVALIEQSNPLWLDLYEQTV
jgi:putative endonuclease